MPPSPSPLSADDLASVVTPQQAALTLTRVLAHTDELDTADLLLPDGRALPVLTRAEVESWLEGLRARARAGERL